MLHGAQVVKLHHCTDLKLKLRSLKDLARRALGYYIIIQDIFLIITEQFLLFH